MTAPQPAGPQSHVHVQHAPQQHRFEVWVGDRLAGFTVYRETDGAYAYVHTEIDPAYEGRGLGSALVRAALDRTREQHLGVLPYCPFVQRFVVEHGDYADLVPVEVRDRFGLAGEGGGHG